MPENHFPPANGLLPVVSHPRAYAIHQTVLQTDLSVTVREIAPDTGIILKLFLSAHLQCRCPRVLLADGVAVVGPQLLVGSAAARG